MSNIGGILKSIQQIMWQDTGLNGDAQRIEQLGWMLFLKIFSDKDKELELLDDNYTSPIPDLFHWVKAKGNWAGDDEGMRLFIGKNIADCTAIYSPFGKYVMEKIDKKYRLSFAVLLGQYQFQSSMPAVDQEINLHSFMARIMLLLQGK